MINPTFVNRWRRPGGNSRWSGGAGDTASGLGTMIGLRDETLE